MANGTLYQSEHYISLLGSIPGTLGSFPLAIWELPERIWELP
jgi:hypothetical protein